MSRLFESDHYRGLYVSDGSRYLQLDAEITAVGLEGSIFTHLEVDVAGIADGCFLPGPAAWR